MGAWEAVAAEAQGLQSKATSDPELASSPLPMRRTMRRRSVTFSEHIICAAGNQPLHMQGDPHQPAESSTSFANLGAMQTDDAHDLASMRTASSPNLGGRGGRGGQWRRHSIECGGGRGGGQWRRHSIECGQYQEKGSSPAASFPFADSSYLPEPFDSPRSLVRRQGSRLSTVLSWKMSKRSGASSPVAGGAEQPEPGALGSRRTGTWDQMSPHSASPSHPLSQQTSYASYAASSTDEAHSPQPTADSQDYVAHHQQQAACAPMVSQPSGLHQHTRPSTRSQSQLVLPSRAYPRYARSASASRRLSSGPVYAGEAPNMASAAQHHTQRSGGSVRNLVRSISTTSRRSSNLAGSVLEAEGLSSGSVYAGESPSMTQQLIARSFGSARGLAHSNSARSRRSSVAGCASETEGLITQACFAQAPTIRDGHQVLDAKAGGGPNVSSMTSTQGHWSRRSSLHLTESVSAAPSSRATNPVSFLPSQPPAHSYLLPGSSLGACSGAGPSSPSPRCQVTHSSHLQQNQAVAVADEGSQPSPRAVACSSVSHPRGGVHHQTAVTSDEGRKPFVAAGACGNSNDPHGAGSHHTAVIAGSQQPAPAGVRFDLGQSFGKQSIASGPQQRHSGAAAAMHDCFPSSGASGGNHLRGGDAPSSVSLSGAGRTSRDAQAAQPAPPQKPAVLEGRPKGWKALSFTKSKLFRSFMP